MSSPAVHSVHIYDEHSALIRRLCGIVSSGLQIGNSVLIIATASHRDQLLKELTDARVDVPEHAREGRFTMYDAQETFATFMLNGKPDRGLFMQSIGNLLNEAKKNVRGNAGLTVFGEMVAVLWEQGKKEAALELERLWNEILNGHPFHLHCAYPRWAFITDEDQDGLDVICRAHSHLVVQ